MIPKFNPETLKVDLVMPTVVENEQQLNDYYGYLKSIGGEMGAITEIDLEPFYFLMRIPQRFSKGSLNKIFGLLNQLASAERFEDAKVARECVNMIEMYRSEMDM